VSQTLGTVELDPSDISGWSAHPFEELLSLSATEVEDVQLAAAARRFESLRPGIAALEALATRQRVDRIGSFEDVATVLFDHRVYKSYPMSLIEKRQFDRLTTWMRRLTTHDVTAFPMEGVSSIDGWLERLDEHGMIMSHSTGTTGKLSFMPRSRSEWEGWQGSFFEGLRAACGVDFRVEAVPLFYPGYRSGNTTGPKMQRIFSELSAAGEEGRYCLYDYAVSSDLLSLAARMRTAEERGELDRLDIDPELLQERKKLIEDGRRREHDLEQWFIKLADEFRGRRVRINGVSADLLRLALKGRERGIQCEFAPGSVLFTAGGLKEFKDAPADWEQILKDFFGIPRLSSFYGMTECMGYAPKCDAGSYHFFPFTAPMLLDAEGNVLPREGAQTGRFAFVDLLAESYWGGFITSDRVTLRWDGDCACGWRSPRIDPEIVRFSELEGGDDKITCAGSEEMYSEFMDYVSNV
jgi:hypothetical protein